MPLSEDAGVLTDRKGERFVTTQLTSEFDALRALAQSRKLRKIAYRHAMVDAEIRHGIADQIRAMRDRRGWSQHDLGVKMGKPQSAIARIERRAREEYPGMRTLLEIARAFDVGVLVRFVPFSEVVRRTLDDTEYEQAPLSFDEEIAALGQARIEIAPAEAPARFRSIATVTSDCITTSIESPSGADVEYAVGG